jgi:hypothetical protein
MLKRKLLRLSPLILAIGVLAHAANMPPPPPGGFPNLPSIAETDYVAAVDVVDGKVHSPHSKTVSEHSASKLNIKSKDEDFNGVLVRGKNSSFTLFDSDITLSGRGTNDFLGLGAGAMVVEGMMLLNDVDIETSGAISSAVVAAEQGILKVVNSRLTAHGGPLPKDYKPVIGPGMMEPPAPLEITGTARTLLVMSKAHAYVYNSEIVADGWGALSTDAAGGDAYLEANDSKVIVNNSGYGAYADFGARVVLNRTDVTAATFTGIIAGEATIEMNDSHTEADRTTVMIHSVMGNPTEIGTLVVKGGQHKSAKEAFLVKSANADISLVSTHVVSRSGVLLRSVVNNDKMRTQVNGKTVPGTQVRIEGSTLEGDIINEDTERSVSVMLQASQLRGAIVNGLFTASKDAQWLATGNSKITLQDDQSFEAIDAARGVQIEVSGYSRATSKTVKARSGGTITFTG